MLLLVGDLAALSAPLVWDTSHYGMDLLLVILAPILFQIGGLYRARLHPSLLDDLPALVGRLLIASALIATATALRHPVRAEPRTFLENALVAALFVLFARSVVTNLIISSRRRGRSIHRVVVVGGGIVSHEVMDILDRWPEHGLRIVGYLDTVEPADRHPKFPYLGVIEALPTVAEELRADVIIVGTGEFSDSAVSAVLARAELFGRDIYVVSRCLAARGGGLSPDQIGAIPVTRLSPANRRLFAISLKRVTDIFLGGTLLLVASPLLVLIAIVRRVESGPGVLFRQTRVGRNGQQFTLLKFRTMTPLPQTDAETVSSVTDSGRVSPVGHLLRRTSLDELPQLWNILRGDMSLVGPRPELPMLVERFSAEHPEYTARHRVAVGLTGLAQVSGLRGDTSLVAHRVRHDNCYIENWSLWLDLKILLRTLGEVVAGRGR